MTLTTWLTLGAVSDAQQQLLALTAAQTAGSQAELPLAPEHQDASRIERAVPGPGAWPWPRWRAWEASDDPSFVAAREAFGRVTRTAFLAGLLSFALAAAAAAGVTRLLTRPLIALTDGARRLEAGERGLRLELPPARDELRTLTEAFNHLVAGLERQEAWRRDLVADIAHDLRTPLAVLQSEIEAMQDGVRPLDPSGLERLHSEVRTLARLVEDLRTLSLAEAGGLSLRIERLELESLLTALLDGFRARAAERGVTLTLTPPPAGLRVAADRDRLMQLLGNLLDNALRYAAPGEVQLAAHEVDPEVAAEEVGAEEDGAAGEGDTGEFDMVSITVRDRGPGLPEEALERLFERFARGDRARTRDRSSEGSDDGGSGLGLTIARALAQAMGGDLVAANHPQGGAVFTVLLPRDPQPAA